MITSKKNRWSQPEKSVQSMHEAEQALFQPVPQLPSTTDPQITAQITQNNRFKWHQKFQPNLSISVTETNFQTMSVSLHYGNLQMEITVIFTHLQEKMFEEEGWEEERGGFGVVRFCWFQGRQYAVKWVEVGRKNSQIDIQKIYKEYFLCCVADVLDAGPKMLRLFGYDIVVSKKMAFFSMQRCSRTIPNSPTFQSQLHQNLSSFHSLHFIHNDIKPENIAYSQLRSKHVFIDFGLSKIIKQQKGNKTMTRFSGSLSYCSDEMRKCCLLNQEMFVDLYDNDLVGLKKSLGKGKIGIGLSGEDEVQVGTQVTGRIGLLGSLVLILKLKFAIEKEDFTAVLNLLQSSNHLTKSVYQIFLTSQIPTPISQHPQIQQKLLTIASLLHKQNFKPLPQDNILCLVFNQSNRQATAQKIIPVSQLLQLQANSLNSILLRTEIVYRLFLYFDPFYNRNGAILGNFQDKARIVEKLWAVRSQNNAQQPPFFCQKLRLVLIFFYERLIENKNLKVMLSLRLLFISIEDWSYVEKLEDKIVAMIDRPVLKMLKIAEFSLFWDWLFQDFDHQRKSKWRNIMEAYSISQISQSHFVEIKVRQLFRLLMVENTYFIYSEDFKNSVIEKIIEVSSCLTDDEEKQPISAITYIYAELAKIHFSQYNFAPQNLAIKIYARFFNFFNFAEEINQVDQYKMFRPLKIQFRMLDSNPSKNLVINVIHHQFEINKNPQAYHDSMFYKQIEIGFTVKQCVSELLQQTKLQIQSYTSYKTIYSLFHHILLIEECICALIFNMENATADQKMCTNQRTFIINEISSLLDKIISREGASFILAESKEIRIALMIVQTQLAFWTEKPEEDVKFLFYQILKLLSPLPYKFPNFALFFITILQYHQGYLQSKQDHYSKDIVVYLSQAYLKAKKYYFFEQIISMLGLYVKIKNERGQSGDFETILAFIEHFRQGKQFYAKGFHNRVAIYAIKVFCRASTFQKLQTVYDEIKLNHLEMVCGLYGYFVFRVFMAIQEKLSFDTNFRQIIRTTLCFPKMSPNCRRKVLPDLLKVVRVLNITTNKKSCNCSRLEGKLLECQIGKQLKRKIEIGHKESTQHALKNLYQRIRQHHFKANQKVKTKLKFYD